MYLYFVYICFGVLNLFRSTEGEYSGVGKHSKGNLQLARILQYLECPQYLRKSFFPQHKDLQYAGQLVVHVQYCLQLP